MRSYCGLYVDAGYLLAAASTRVSGTSLRASTTIDAEGLIDGLIKQATTTSNLPLLRVHWYDSGSDKGALDAQQSTIAAMRQVKFRRGRRGLGGEQKGIDVRLGLDLVTQARHRAVDLVYLVSGDDDLTEAVEEAQHVGVQVIVLAVPDRNNSPMSVSRHLRMASDGVELIDADLLDKNVRIVSSAGPAASAASAASAVSAPSTLPGQDDTSVKATPLVLAGARAERTMSRPHATDRHVVYISSSDGGRATNDRNRLDDSTSAAIDDVVTRLVGRWRNSASQAEVADLLISRPTIPAEIDRTLLQDLSASLQVYELSDAQRIALRAAFWRRFEPAEGTLAGSDS